MYALLFFSTRSLLTLFLGLTSPTPVRRRRPRSRLPLLSTPLYSGLKSSHSPFFVRTSKPYTSLVRSPQSTGAPFYAAFMPSLTPILPRSQRVRPFSTGLLTWPIALYKTDYKDIQRINGPDAYFFVRFLRVMIRVLVPIWIISWIVLLPVTSVNNSIPGNTGLSRFTLGNIAPNHKERYAAFIILVWLSTCESYVCESDAD